MTTLLSSCANDDPELDEMDENPEEPLTTPNILFIIADDMGLDATSGYPEGNLKLLTLIH